MREDLLLRLMRENLRKWAKLPPEVRFREMVERGVIDEKGNVLVRMPEPPRVHKDKAQERSHDSHAD